MFNSDPTLFYNAQQKLIDGFNVLKSKRSEINDLTSSFPRGFEYKNEINQVTTDLNSVITKLSGLERKVSDTKDKLINLDNMFGIIYYECASKKYDNLHGRLTSNESNYVEYAQVQYNAQLFKYLDDLNKSGELTPEMQIVYEQLKISNNITELENKLSSLKEGSEEYQSVLDEYNKELDKILDLQISQLESKETLTEDEKLTLKNLKDTKNISAYERELAELEKNPVRNPGVPGGRMTEAQANAYKEQSKLYWDYENKKKELKNKIKAIQKENGTYVNKWYEDWGKSFSKTGAQWKKGFQSLFNGEGFKELGTAVKQTVATNAVIYNSAKSGVLKLGEYLFDGGTAVVGSVAAGITWLFDNDEAGNVMDWTLDEIRKDRVGDANKSFYENTELGKWINENSNLKYDSAGAKAIQTTTEFVGKIALATAATIVTGGAAVPFLAMGLGAMYGVGKAGEQYTQSVDRLSGENYSYGKFFGKSAAGALSGAAEFYGYGQMGAGIYNGVKSLSGAATLTKEATQKTATTFGKSFAKNFLEVDTFLDSGAVIVDHGVNWLTGDATLSEALKSAGVEFSFALGLNALGAGIGAKVETKGMKVNSNSLDLPGDKKTVRKMLGDKISVISTKVKTTGTNFTERLKNIKSKLELTAIKISTNPTINNILSNPAMMELAYNPTLGEKALGISMLEKLLPLLTNKRAIKEVMDNADFTQKILTEGMVHFAPSEDIADAIISSKVLRSQKLELDIMHPMKTVKYVANQGSKTFLFGGIPTYEEMLLNVDIKPTMVGVRIKPDKSQLADLGYRYLDDNALIHNGDLDLSPSKSVEKVYVGLKYDRATNRFYYKEISKAEFDNYKLDIDESEFKRLKSVATKTKTQIDLTYGKLKSDIDERIIEGTKSIDGLETSSQFVENTTYPFNGMTSSVLSQNISKNTSFEQIYKTMSDKYGEENALSQIKKYIETGNIKLITRENNARSLIASLSIEELTKCVDEIDGAKYFKVAGDLSSNKSSFEEIFKTMSDKYGEENALSQIRKYFETGNIKLITRKNNARGIISNMTLNDFNRYLNIKMNDAYNGLLLRYGDEFELNRRIQIISNTGNWNYLDNSEGLVSKLYNYTGGNLELLDEFLISKKLSKYSDYELIGTEISKVGDSSPEVNLTEELKFFKIYDSSNNTYIYVQQNLDYKRDVDFLLRALDDLKTKSPNLAANVNDIYFTSIDCPSNPYWANIHNDPNFTCAALGGGGTIQFFGTFANENILATIYHEAAHTLDNYEYINNSWMHSISDSTEWSTAVSYDNNWASNYAQDAFNSRNEGRYCEDVADSIVNLRIMGSVEFIKMFPNRANVLYNIVPELFN